MTIFKETKIFLYPVLSFVDETSTLEEAEKGEVLEDQLNKYVGISRIDPYLLILVQICPR